MKKKRYYPKRVTPGPILTRMQKVFKSVGLKKPAFRNLCLVTTAICVARTFRINEIASRLPKQHLIPLNLYAVRDEAFKKDPTFVISNTFTGQEIYHLYKRRMQIEHGP